MLTVDIRVYGTPELKDLASDEAAKDGIALSEWIVRAIADKLGRPDLRHVPRKPPGRRPKRACVPA